MKLRRHRACLEKGQEVFIRISDFLENSGKDLDLLLPFGLIGIVRERVEEGPVVEYDKYLVELHCFRSSEAVARLFESEVEMLGHFLSRYSYFDAFAGKFIVLVTQQSCLTDFRPIFQYP